MKQADEFWAQVDRTRADGCWLWTGSVNQAGYGRTCFRGHRKLAHRLAWELTHGWLLTSGRVSVVCHSCDRPACVNPSHLFLGSLGDNNRDRDSKGRQARGDGHGRAILCEDQVADIREAYAAGGIAQQALAARFGVSRSLVGDIIRGKRWAHTISCGRG